MNDKYNKDEFTSTPANTPETPEVGAPVEVSDEEGDVSPVNPVEETF